MRETPLAGGDMNVVVRVGDTVRRPPEPPGVRALLQWYERVGFDGAPRFLGVDEQGREVLSFVEGAPAFAPVPTSDDVVAGIRIDEQLHDWGIPVERRGERLRLLCDAYGLAADQRGSLLDVLIGHRRQRLERGAFRGTAPRSLILANLRWTEEHAAQLATFLA